MIGRICLYTTSEGLCQHKIQLYSPWYGPHSFMVMAHGPYNDLCLQT